MTGKKSELIPYCIGGAVLVRLFKQNFLFRVHCGSNIIEMQLVMGNKRLAFTLLKSFMIDVPTTLCSNIM